MKLLLILLLSGCATSSFVDRLAESHADLARVVLVEHPESIQANIVAEKANELADESSSGISSDKIGFIAKAISYATVNPELIGAIMMALGLGKYGLNKSNQAKAHEDNYNRSEKKRLLAIDPKDADKEEIV